MDTHSSSDDQFTNEELHDAPPTRKAIPHKSLLDVLHSLIMKHEASNLSHEGSAFRLTSDMRLQIWTLKRELKFQQTVFMFLKNLIFSNHWVLSVALDCIQTIAETAAETVKEAAVGLNAHPGLEARSFYFKQWESGVSKFMETVDQKIKPNLKEFCLGTVNQFLQGDSSRMSDIVEFIDIISLKLKNLEISRSNLTDPMRKHMEILEEMLHLFCIIAGKETNLNKFNLPILELVESIKALKPSNVSEILRMREIVGRLTDMILENLIASTDDRFDMLREGLTLWIALLMNPPKTYAEDEKLIYAQTNLLVEKAESLIHSLCLDNLGEDIAERRNILLNGFLGYMNKAKANVRQLHVEIPGFSRKSLPQTNRRGFFDFLLGNLQKKFQSQADMFPFEKHLIAIVHNELSHLRPFLMNIFELQDEHEEMRDIWFQASRTAYLVDYVTDSCLSLIDVPIWSNLMHLSNAIEQIQFVRTKVSRKNDQMYKNGTISAKVNSKLVPCRQQQASATTKDDVKVGFADEEQRIIDQLIAGEVGLDIIAIVGMAGLGKTTLAQRVFEDSRVKLHFHEYAWCCVSQAYDTTEIFLDILENIGEPVSQGEDLADRLRKCLMGRRYLVVLDDIWDVKAWNELKLSFPDDNNGSRILLTSRNRNVPLQAKPHCCIVQLNPLSFEESWYLLRMKVFGQDWCDPTLSDIGEMIAKNCKGLPLAIVVVAGLLKKHENVDSWKQISKRMNLLITSKGCKNLLNLSYNDLPDYLKPCFLYLGAFKEDQMIDAKRLIQFWIVEGFIQSDGMKSKEAVANEYLMDLVSRSLVIVAQRSSRYGIKKCRVHDLLRELCLTKAKEERFLLVPKVSYHFPTIRNDHCRLSVHGEWEPSVDSKAIVPSLRTLLVSGCHRCHYFKRFKLLRVLDLSHAFLERSDFDEITQFVHLRFLYVRCRFAIPSSIVNLFRLEVLRLRYFGTRRVLPSVVMKMANLRHIFANSCRFEYAEDFEKVKLDFCPPLTNLETFTSLDFGDESSFNLIAEKLPNMLKLGLKLSFCVLLSSYFKKLESLKLHISPSQKMAEAISPSTLDFPLTLKKLNLTAKFPLSAAMVSSIGKLSNLEVLKLDARFEDGRWDVKDDDFLELKYLELRFSSIQNWTVSDKSFRRLEQLVVKKCPKLGEVPDRFAEIMTWKRIEVHNCSGSVRNSFQQIVDDQKEYGNEGLQFSIS